MGLASAKAYRHWNQYVLEAGVPNVMLLFTEKNDPNFGVFDTKEPPAPSGCVS